MSDFAKDTNVPTNDCISRQAAIDALHKKRLETMGKGQDVNQIWECLDVIAQVPSAQPEIIQKLSELIEKGEMTEEEARNELWWAMQETDR